MKGIDQLLKLRRKGFKPAAAFVADSDDAFTAEFASSWLDEQKGNPALHAQIQIEAADTPERLDFRALIGLPVHVYGWRSDDRTVRLYEAIKQYQPELVLTVLSNKTLMIYRKETGDELHPNA